MICEDLLCVKNCIRCFGFCFYRVCRLGGEIIFSNNKLYVLLYKNLGDVDLRSRYIILYSGLSCKFREGRDCVDLVFIGFLAFSIGFCIC